MKITKQQLKRIIKEEMERVLEARPPSPERSAAEAKLQKIRKILEAGVGPTDSLAAHPDWAGFGHYDAIHIYEQIEEIVTGGTPSDVEDVDDPDWRRPPPGVLDSPPPESFNPSHAGASAEVGGQTVYAKRKPKF